MILLPNFRRDCIIKLDRPHVYAKFSSTTSKDPGSIIEKIRRTPGGMLAIFIFIRQIIFIAALLFGCSGIIAAQGDAKPKEAETSIIKAPQKLYTFIKDSANIKEIREEIARWDQSVRGFRKDHQFSLLSGYVVGTWKFKRLGDQINRSHDDSGAVAKFSYSYHIPIYRSFGYFLGTSFGGWEPTAQSDGARIQSAMMLPGVLAGVVLNPSPGLRLMTGVDYYLERWTSLRPRTDGQDLDGVSVTARSTDWIVASDIFYRLKWAIRLELHQRHAEFRGTRGGSGSVVNAVVERRDRWIAGGFLYHLM